MNQEITKLKDTGILKNDMLPKRENNDKIKGP